MFREMDDKYGIAAALHGLGLLACSEGDFATAGAMLRESLSLRRAMGNRRYLAESLEAWAQLSIAAGKIRMAARLFGAAEALREMVGAPRPAVDHAEYTQAMAELHAQLDEAAFSWTWSEGRAMTLEQAVKYALEEGNG
jgi:hypothetical protein